MQTLPLALAQLFALSTLPGLIAATAIAATSGMFQLGFLRPLQAPIFPMKSRRLRRALSFKRIQVSRDWLFILAFSTPLGTIAQDLFLPQGPNPRAITGLLYGIFLVFMAACDRRFKCMPTNVLWASAAATAGLSISQYGFVPPQEAVLGFLAGALLVGLPGFLYLNARRAMGIGPADLPLVAGVGALIGLQVLGVIMIVTALIALPYQAVLAARNAGPGRTTIPFGLPFAFAALSVLALQIRAPDWIALKLEHTAFWVRALF